MCLLNLVKLDTKRPHERTCDDAPWRVGRRDRLAQIIAAMLKEALAFEAGTGAS